MGPYGQDEMGFWFWGSTEYSVRFQQQLFAHILERNEIIRRVAARTKTPLVDLYAAFDSSREDDFRRWFFDVAHPRASSYPRLAEVVFEGGVRSILARDVAVEVA